MDTVRLSEFINTQAVVFCGCTTTEISSLLGFCAVVATILAGMPGIVFFGFSLAAGLAALATLLFFMAGTHILRRLKHGVPDHHYRLCWIAFLARVGVRRSPVMRSGIWGVGRSLYRKI